MAHVGHDCYRQYSCCSFGSCLDDWVHDHFYNAYTVAAMLILYGIIFIVLEAHNRKRAREVIESAEQPRGKHARKIDASDPESVESALFRITDPYDMDWKTALKIGFFEVLAIVPGTSRSGATIIGGMLCGCSRTARQNSRSSWPSRNVWLGYG